MDWIWIVLGCVAGLGLLVLLAAYICYRIAFYAPDRKPGKDGVMDLPNGEIYEPYLPSMAAWAQEAKGWLTAELEVVSFDGLTLRGKYYEYAPGAPIELMFHGYRGSAERDLSGGVQRCFRLGRSALVVNQRASGDSEGNVISFGVNEHRDCLTWVEFMVRHFGPEVKIILTGISMGASTVLSAADKPLPDNVIGILADCGYSSAREIIQTVIRQMGLPVWLCYPLVKLGARLYGRFDLEETTPLEAVKHSTCPIIFFHGEADAFVPCEMSRRCYEACASRKRLVTVPGAGHGLCYPVAPEAYLQALQEFFGEQITGIKE